MLNQLVDCTAVFDVFFCEIFSAAFLESSVIVNDQFCESQRAKIINVQFATCVDVMWHRQSDRHFCNTVKVVTLVENATTMHIWACNGSTSITQSTLATHIVSFDISKPRHINLCSMLNGAHHLSWSVWCFQFH